MFRSFSSLQDEVVCKPQNLKGKSAKFIATGILRGLSVKYQLSWFLLLRVAFDGFGTAMRSDQCPTNFPAVKHLIVETTKGQPPQVTSEWDGCEVHVGHRIKGSTLS